MPKKDDQEQSNASFIVCDANVAIQMAIFSASKMFNDATYTFGTFQVHEQTIDELRRWLRPGSRKLIKFGKDVIELAIEKSEAAGCGLKNLATDEFRKKALIYDAIETKLAETEKSADTSREDKLVLALADKHKCFLATQETTLRTLAKKVIGSRLLSFEDLVCDLYGSGQITADDIKDGIGNLDYFKERLRGDQKFKVLAILKNPT